ncbi:hypothetical protein AVEN_229501-1 [Araneus ventricosus]|uniref:Uncharacterized protein n=1 Tax=Araneus ventricosus TaxID=182803 RepID=A0A4Y2RRG4_ARAVE|nr:hypothetical protein AVEN_229501-1 [Araneus ventricosus]
MATLIASDAVSDDSVSLVAGLQDMRVAGQYPQPGVHHRQLLHGLHLFRLGVPARQVGAQERQAHHQRTHHEWMYPVVLDRKR